MPTTKVKSFSRRSQLCDFPAELTDEEVQVRMRCTEPWNRSDQQVDPLSVHETAQHHDCEPVRLGA